MILMIVSIVSNGNSVGICVMWCSDCIGSSVC